MFHVHASEFVAMCGVAIALLVVSNAWVYLRVLRPVSRLAQQSKALEHGDLAALEATCGGINEISELRLSMASMVRHVRRAQTQHAAYAERLADSREDERKRIAHELHDTTIQSLVAVAQAVDLARTWLRDQPQRVEEALTLAREQAANAVAELRDHIADLRPPALEELGLGAALGMLADKPVVPKTRLDVTGTSRRLNEAAELTVFRAAQEALSNAARHGKAQSAELTLAYSPDAVTLTVHDDGSGFEVPRDLNDLVLEGHYGLMGLRERVGNLNGTVTVTSIPGGGTTIVARIPTGVITYDSARDPVCGTAIEPGRAYKQTNYGGRLYTFCCPVCQGAFEAEPERYMPSQG